jgi:hypothetical protein
VWPGLSKKRSNLFIFFGLQGMIPTCQSQNFFKPSSKNSKKIVETMVKKLAAACLF